MKIFTKIVAIVCIATIFCCTKSNTSKIVYKTESLVIEQLSPTVYKHVSYLQTNDFGNVPCNGMIYITENQAMVFDTPTTDLVSKELIDWLKNIKKTTVNGVVVNHFHDDCLGGLQGFHDEEITSYASNKTIILAKKDSIAIPKNGFESELELTLGHHKISTKFLGEGHTKDNTVSFLETEKVLFGGCMIKALKAKKGYLGDANIAQWSKTVTNVKKTFPNVKTVIPGHGKVGDVRLLDYTIQLFQ